MLFIGVIKLLLLEEEYESFVILFLDKFIIKWNVKYKKKSVRVIIFCKVLID